MFHLGRSSLGSLYREAVSRGLSQPSAAPPVTEEDLRSLPPLVGQYLKRVGVVGQPRVRSFRARFSGRMRNGKAAPWMSIQAEQFTFFTVPSRLFLMDAKRSGIPFQALHLYESGRATMQVRVASLLQVVDARGPVMDRSETVTFFNDMCLLAPASLLDADIHWQEVNRRTVSGTLTLAGQTVTAQLEFDDSGDLTEFRSNDRAQSADGKTYRQLPWSTPVGRYRPFHEARLAAYGEALWLEPEGSFSYAQFDICDVEYNVRAP